MIEPAPEGAVEIPLESAPNDFNDDDIHKSLDKEVLHHFHDYFTHTSLSNLRDVTMLLMEIVLYSRSQLEINYADFHQALALLRKHPELVNKLKVAYAAGSFKEIRNLSMYNHPLDALVAIIYFLFLEILRSWNY